MTSKYDNWTAQRTIDTSPFPSQSKNGIVSKVQGVFKTPAKLLRFLTYSRSNPRVARRRLWRWLASRMTSFVTVLTLVWICVLYFGEASSHNRAIRRCEWDTWEQWPQGATPHHLVFIADPQLVDPHTYPGRPWPISTLTIKHTDLYLRRVYSRIQRVIDPSTVILLGDLFDGGREWSTATSHSPEEQYWVYGESFWQDELARFQSIFLREWSSNTQNQEASARKIIASLPGNHDLGFSTGIQIPVRDRFVTTFGESNRIDVIGNHTFVSLDTVSLSAKDRELELGARYIWKPTDDFLNGVSKKKTQAIAEALGSHTSQQVRRSAGQDVEQYTHSKRTPSLLSSRNDEKTHRIDSQDSTDIPTILLTHVPLYRNPGTPCGPLRERHPPSLPPPGQATPLNPDDRNAISISAGYQYQNVISESLTHYIATTLGGDLEYAFSGDDHDYCEVVHEAYPSRGGMGIREITVKSISWAMGVRKPGFLLVSLWNPVDEQGKRLRMGAGALGEGQPTMQTHLCLLPDQLSIFIRYAILVGISILVLFLRALLLAFRVPSNASTPLSPTSATSPTSPWPLLPTTSSTVGVPTDLHTFSFTAPRRRAISSATEREKAAALALPYLLYHASPSPFSSHRVSVSGVSTPPADDGMLPARGGGQLQRRQASPFGGEEDGFFEEDLRHHDEAEVGVFGGNGRERKGYRKGKVRMVLVEWGLGLWRVARVALVWFGVLVLWA